MNTPFYDKIKKLSKIKTRFFVPGHKGNKAALPQFGDAVKYDITEIDGADDLQNPQGTLLQSQHNMAMAFGVGASVYSTQGSTSCIQAMLTTFLNKGDAVIMARNSHISAIRTVAFLNLKPVWLWQNEQNEIDFNELEKLIQKNKAAAVYLTSPNYFGFLADVKSAALICNKYNIPLLVDNAHGAYIKFADPRLYPITLGATACAESLHKTMPCLTGAAVLQLKDKIYADRARWAMNLYCSTSPSYLVLCSMDLLAGKLLDQKIDFAACVKRCDDLRQKLGALALSKPNMEPCKITLCPQNTGYTVSDVLSQLKKYNIAWEMATDKYIVLMATSYNTSYDFAKLQKALKKFTLGMPSKVASFAMPMPEQVMPIDKALFAPKVQMTTASAPGQIAAGMLTPCPPGVPVIMPGERLTTAHCEALIKSGIFKIDVVK